LKKLKKNLGGKSSGQLLIVAALSIAVLISSTTIYVYEVSRETNSIKNNSISDFVLAVKQSTRNAMISSLVNASNGGERTVLTDNLNSFSQALRSLYQFGTCQLNFTVLNDVGYDSGMRFSWNDSGLGISSAYADFTLKIYGVTSNTVVNYAVNVTTTLTVNGSYTIVENEEKLVNLTCKIYNEGEPALAKNMTVFYENLWKLGSRQLFKQPFNNRLPQRNIQHFLHSQHSLKQRASLSSRIRFTQRVCSNKHNMQ